MSGPQDPQDPNAGDPPAPGPAGRYGPPQQPGGQPQYPSQPYPQQYPQQQYPQQQYPQQPYPPQQWQAAPGQPGQPGYPAPGAARPTLAQRLGDRALRRPAPRLGVTLTGVGVVLVILGVVIWSFTYLFDGIRDGLISGGGLSSSDSRRFLGFALALIVVALGYALVISARTGPLVTAGVAASAIGIPIALEFATFDLSGGDPVNTDVIVWVSVIAYLISYLFVRGARGHTFYLALTLAQVWGYAVGKAGPDSSTIGTSVIGGVNGAPTSTNILQSVDTETIAAVSLIFAVGYFLAAWYLDRTGKHGVALPFAVVGIPAMLVGIGALAPDTKQIGTGILLLLVGLVLCYYGARFERRFTAWFWGLVAAGGAVTIVAKIATQGVAIGVTLIVLGVVFAAGGWFAAKTLGETDDMAGPRSTAPSPAEPATPAGTPLY